MAREFSRGDVWIVDLGPVAKIRPAVVVSIPFEDQDRALVSLIPHTTAFEAVDSKFHRKQDF
jgi:mRNA-degrading endonuclease toxin of MazEF toxin-antitoxin module